MIEFQKRGLPHAHILLWINPADKPTTPEHVDSIVCAEIPDRHSDPKLFDIVTKCMLHGPCGPADPNCGCMKNKNNKCRFRYPKPYVDNTTVDEDGKATYRRRDIKEREVLMQVRLSSGKSAKYKFTNQHVVPYNKGILLKYNCHINVEICTGIFYMNTLYIYMLLKRCMLIKNCNISIDLQTI